MDTDKDLQKSINSYERLRRSILVHRYDIVGRILVAIVFVIAVLLLIFASLQPQSAADYQEWIIAFSVIVVAVFLASMVSDLMVARILIEELDRLKDQMRALERENSDNKI